MIAWNKCCDCENEWQDKPLGFAELHRCPACGSEYWEWTNYAEQNRSRSGSSPNSGQVLTANAKRRSGSKR